MVTPKGIKSFLKKAIIDLGKRSPENRDYYLNGNMQIDIDMNSINFDWQSPTSKFYAIYDHGKENPFSEFWASTLLGQSIIHMKADLVDHDWLVSGTMQKLEPKQLCREHAEAIEQHLLQVKYSPNKQISDQLRKHIEMFRGLLKKAGLDSVMSGHMNAVDDAKTKTDLHGVFEEMWHDVFRACEPHEVTTNRSATLSQISSIAKNTEVFISSAKDRRKLTELLRLMSDFLTDKEIVTLMAAVPYNKRNVA